MVIGRRVPVAIWAALIAAALLTAGPAQAAFPGQNGRIAFVHLTFQSVPSDIYSAEPDGAGLAQLTEDGVSDNPAYSPDGSQLAFTSGTKVYIGDQYANDPQLVLDFGVGAYGLDWSPDATHLVASFPNCAEADCEPDIYTFGVDGTGLTNITNTLYAEFNPSWAADDSKIAFESMGTGAESDIYTVNPDGSGLQNITADPGMTANAVDPDWSPDASRIAFMSATSGSGVLWTANPDGSGRTQIINTFAQDPTWSPDGARFAYTDPPESCCGETYIVFTTGPHPGFYSRTGDGRDPDWQVRQPEPVPAASGSGYPRPKGATPVLVPLVVNYNKCTQPTKQHGPPLAYPSCVPARTGQPVTVGTPDSNGKTAEASGSVRLDTLVGDPTTPADEADVHIHVQQTDVWNAFPVNAMTDYAGSLVMFAPLRTTDRWNDGGDASGTVVDFPLRVAVPCVATAGPEGGTCSVDTTVDAVIPGLVRERKRTVWQLGQVLVHYAGGDNNPHTLEDNRPLFAQGVFVP